MCGVGLARREGGQGEHLLKEPYRLSPSPFLLNAALKPQWENKVWECTCGWQHADGLDRAWPNKNQELMCHLPKPRITLLF